MPRATKSPLLWTGARRGRGSAILLVLAVLSLLVLLAVAMSYTSRLELASAANFAEKTALEIRQENQVLSLARDLGRSYPPGATGRLDVSLDADFRARRPGPWQDRELVEALQSFAPDDPGSEVRRGARVDGLPSLSPYHAAGGGVVRIDDLSGRVNVNTAPPEVIGRVLDSVGARANMAVRGAAIGEAIARVRSGPDGAPGTRGRDDNLGAADVADLLDSLSPQGLAPEGRPLLDVERANLAARGRTGLAVDAGRARELAERRAALYKSQDHEAEFIGDPVLEAYGDDIRFVVLEDMLDHRAIRDAGLTPALLGAARPFLTTVSASRAERFVPETGRTVPLVDVNRASVTEIYEVLVGLYPDKHRDLLRQFAVNVVDARDFDSVPTRFPGRPVDKPVLGIERVPFITEVYANSLTPAQEGDEGEFIEIHNPWGEPIDVSGWRLVGPGVDVTLRGAIPPNGFLIVTDDLDNRKDDNDRHLGGTGSLYDIFGVLPGAGGQVIEDESLSLPDYGPPVVIELTMPGGDTADVFVYAPPLRRQDAAGGMYSYQRLAPHVRTASLLRATPFGLAPGASMPSAEARDRLANYPPDAPFTSPAELLGVFAGFVSHEGEVAAPWAFPVVATPRSSDRLRAAEAARPEVIDARLVDAFTVRQAAPLVAEDAAGADEARRSWGRAVERRRGEIAERFGEEAAARAASTLALAPEEAYVFGRVNLNSADELVLAALPGVGEEAARVLAEERLAREEDVRRGRLSDGLLFHHPSDVLVHPALFGEAVSDQERLLEFAKLWDLMSLNSRAFELEARNLEDAGGGEVRQRGRTLRAVVAYPGETPLFVMKRSEPR